MRLLHKVILALLVYIVVFSAAFQILYGGIMTPEPDKYFNREISGRQIAANYGWGYEEMLKISDAPEYGFTGAEQKASYERFKEQAGRTLSTNDSALIAVFTKDSYHLRIMEEYWYLKKGGKGLLIAKVLEPTVTYPIPVSEWGPFDNYQIAWTANITNERIVFSKPSVDILRLNFRLFALFTFLIFTFGLIALVGLLAFFLLFLVFLTDTDNYKKKA